MKNLIFRTSVLLLLGLLYANLSLAQINGIDMPASGPEDYFIINKDKSAHYGAAQFNTNNTMWELRNNPLYGDGLGALEFRLDDGNGTGPVTKFVIDAAGNMRVNNTVKRLGVLVGHDGIEFYGTEESTDVAMKVHADNHVSVGKTLTVGHKGNTNELVDLVPGTVLTIDGRLHISAEGAIPVEESGSSSITEAPFDAVEYEDFLMWVDGGVVMEKYAIFDSEEWADFVFDDDFQLRSLDDLQAFIDEHGHLPTIPSAAAVKNGYKLHEMNTQLLQTIEELTLHTIEMDKQIRSLQERVQQLQQ